MHRKRRFIIIRGSCVRTGLHDYKEILASKDRINQIIYEELMEIQRKFGDKRRTELMVGEVLS
ncbi:hypothetical protein LDK41_14780, partial [Lactiplantibacillus plantarum]|nr:hypothetical protein [Lactiplantibacillus plantarum]